MLKKISDKLSVNLKEIAAVKKRGNGLASILIEGVWIDTAVLFNVMINMLDEHKEEVEITRTVDELAS